MGILNWL